MKLKYNIGDILVEKVQSGKVYSQFIIIDTDNKNGSAAWCPPCIVSTAWCYKVIDTQTGKVCRQSYRYVDEHCKKVG